MRRAYAAELEGLDDGEARRLLAVLHLVASSNGALFMKDYWDLPPRGHRAGHRVGDPGAGRRGHRPGAEGGAVTITWEAPAGGLWALETLHLPGAVPRLFQERAPGAFVRGFQPAGRRYGLPIDYLEIRFVNDHCYARMRPVGAPDPKPGKETQSTAGRRAVAARPPAPGAPSPEPGRRSPPSRSGAGTTTSPAGRAS